MKKMPLIRCEACLLLWKLTAGLHSPSTPCAILAMLESMEPRPCINQQQSLRSRWKAQTTSVHCEPRGDQAVQQSQECLGIHEMACWIWPEDEA